MLFVLLSENEYIKGSIQQRFQCFCNISKQLKLYKKRMESMEFETHGHMDRESYHVFVI